MGVCGCRVGGRGGRVCPVGKVLGLGTDVFVRLCRRVRRQEESVVPPWCLFSPWVRYRCQGMLVFPSRVGKSGIKLPGHQAGARGPGRSGVDGRQMRERF